MRLNRRIYLQLTIFAVIAMTGVAVLLLGYVDVPGRVLGLGKYQISIELPQSVTIYKNANVTYRGSEVGLVDDVHLTASGGAVAVLSLDAKVPIPADLEAQVDSVSGLGEQYIALLPRSAAGPILRGGDVISRSHTSAPPPVDRLLDATNRGLEAIPRDNLKTVIDQASIAVGGLGPELSRIVNGSTALAIDASAQQDSLNALIDGSGPVLDSQSSTSRSIAAWAANLASITGQLRTQDTAVAGVISNGSQAFDQGQQLLERLRPSLPVLLANLVSVADVAVVYNRNIEQILVLAPQAVAASQAAMVPNLNVPGPGRNAVYFAAPLNMNLPPPCSTGYLPPQQRLSPSVQDAPERPQGDLYCRIPQDSWNDVRGARNIPCETKPWKRAPTVKMCESDEDYVPLNDGMNWKGDPNATLSGQDVPQMEADHKPAGAPQSLVPILPVAGYDPATGKYIGPDGKPYIQTDLAQQPGADRTWKSMLVPGG